MTHSNTEATAKVDADLQRDAIVVFHGVGGRHPLDPYLRAGFKHVFIAVVSGSHWIILDGYRGVPHAQVIASSDFDLGKFYASQPGMTAVRYPRRVTPEAKWPLALSNCVGMVKTLLGVNAPLAFTPWQLYMRLRANGAVPCVSAKSAKESEVD
tara:strand:- start:635 stop:1096 length:462 start_codon:yes stop_codon:yes gene_type:complete